MKKLFLALMALCCLSTMAMAQEVQENQEITDYNIKANKAGLARYLNLSDIAADKLDAWQTAMQDKIDKAIALPEAERNATIKQAITEYMDLVREYLNEGTYRKYIQMFRNTLQNHKMDRLLL